MLTISVVILALLADFVFGEPVKYHPLVGFGNIALSIEKKFNHSHDSALMQFVKGTCALLLITTPFVFFVYILVLWCEATWCLLIVETLALYWAVGHKSLREHIVLVLFAIKANDIDLARSRIAMIVSRDTDQLNKTQITQASIETGLENGSDAIFAPLFWFCVLGAPAVVAYRLINTLDAMWGYKSDRFLYFGKAAARIDDVLNWVPARLVAFSYSLLGNTTLALKCWRDQAASLSSPNAGPVMVSGAGALNIQLGGPTHYHGQLMDKPFFGSSIQVTVNDIQRSLNLISHTLILWCCVILCFSLMARFL